MVRLALPTLDDMKPEQRAVYAQTVAGRRGSVPANVLVWLHSPDLAARAQKLGEFVRYDTKLPPRHSELAILVVARHWSARYEWAIHAAEATRAGVPDAVIDAIRERRPPAFEDEASRAIFDFTGALVSTGQVPDDLYKAAVAELGVRPLVELVALVGYYTMVALTLNAFEIPAPAGSSALD
jgi:4-carboxymuconolactone decarboxylase